MTVLRTTDERDPNIEGARLVRFCPGCGKSDPFDPHDFGALDNSDSPYNPVFDVLCKRCGWSGDISPDLEPRKEDAR